MKRIDGMMTNAAVCFGWAEGPYEFQFTINDDTWRVFGDTVDEVMEEAQELLNDYTLTEDQIMAMETTEELELAAQDEKAVQKIFEVIRDWAENDCGRVFA